MMKTTVALALALTAGSAAADPASAPLAAADPASAPLAAPPPAAPGYLTPGDQAPPHAASRPDPTVAITISPVHLFIPMIELTAELRVAPKFGIAVIAGMGVFREKTTDTKINLYEGGVSARYYVTGSFRSGVQLGAEAAYVKADTGSTGIEVEAAGLALSPFVGYKWTHRTGFTFDGQLGAAFMALRAKAETGEMAEASKVGPMLNLNLGYSF